MIINERRLRGGTQVIHRNEGPSDPSEVAIVINDEEIEGRVMAEEARPNLPRMSVQANMPPRFERNQQNR
jgi:hypothetical protein